MEKIVQCRVCASYFKGNHNSLYCRDCAKLRAKQASAQTWLRIKLKNERKRSERYGRQVGTFEIDKIDVKLAQEAGKSVGQFQLWKFAHESEYAGLLEQNGYHLINGVLYDGASAKNMSNSDKE